MPPKAEKFQCNPGAIYDLTKLQEETKFGEEEYYAGLLPEEDRPQASEILDQSIDNLIDILKTGATKEQILNEYKRALTEFDGMKLDTEDMERVCQYYDVDPGDQALTVRMMC